MQASFLSPSPIRFKNNGDNFSIELPPGEPRVSNVSVPEDLVQIQAYLRWERKGKQMYTPEQEKVRTSYCTFSFKHGRVMFRNTDGVEWFLDADFFNCWVHAIECIFVLFCRIKYGTLFFESKRVALSTSSSSTVVLFVGFIIFNSFINLKYFCCS